MEGSGAPSGLTGLTVRRMKVPSKSVTTAFFVRFEALWRSWVTSRARVRGSAATLAVVGHEMVGVVGHVDVGLRVVWLLLARHEALLASLAPPAAEAGQEEQRHGGDLESFGERRKSTIFLFGIRGNRVFVGVVARYLLGESRNSRAPKWVGNEALNLTNFHQESHYSGVRV